MPVRAFGAQVLSLFPSLSKMVCLISSLAPASITHFTDYIFFTPARAEACFALCSSVATLPSRML